MDALQNTLSPDEMLERMQMLRFKVHEKKIEEVWGDLTEAGFEPLLIKGWGAAQFYPQPFKREFSDIDIVIAPEKFDEAEVFLQNNSRGYNVDLHRGLRRHDSLKFEEIYSKSRIYDCGNVKIRVPRPEDHLRILCVHWLTDGGAYKEKLWDIYYGIDNRAADFDWQRFLESVSRKRRRWIVCTVGLAHKYLNLPIEKTPIADEAKNLPKWLTKSLEAEWQNESKLQPLQGMQYKNERVGFWRQIADVVQHNFKNNRENFIEQLRKRIFPNPISATVDVEGDFDGEIRVLYQLRSFFKRLGKIGMMKDV
jgi:hypothetical protein